MRGGAIKEAFFRALSDAATTDEIYGRLDASTLIEAFGAAPENGPGTCPRDLGQNLDFPAVRPRVVRAWLLEAVRA